MKHKTTFDISRLDFWKCMCVDVDFMITFATQLKQQCDALVTPTTNGVYIEFPLLNDKTQSQKAYYSLIPTHFTGHPNYQPFEEHLTKRANINKTFVVFSNIGGDTLLITPGLGNENQKHAQHLSDFVRHASIENIVELFVVVANIVLEQYQQHQNIYVSTHGHGVDWLHVRISPTPKYYHKSSLN